ncbi:hypothetical protein GPJ56_001745 [Histomonas meleagridis]|uniref:uncharacterized protein n=1 Tax=Histomonas meleagridis TaxID=135588 RepID=UPI00355A716A|nr:hypothetical protein GPJ56_001745 [Histomonas meleagridis]KAH0806519.1 hypothetical protein GO595_000681 [Histomonas meleagridis]
MDGGIICSNDFKARMVVESLSTFWQALLPPHWKRIGFEWETSYIVLVNCGGWIFGLQQNDPNPLTLGLLRLKATKCAEFIKSKLEEN